ncbi:MAG: UpxY family transcription antiterminator [Bacteroidetes bacterium]|nr:UpxY family transcription antiterminator [Bacteroidota bacterium]
MTHWYAIYVNVKHEKKVVNKLLEKGIIAYAPVTRKLRQWSDRKKWVEFPMLSGYVFVNIEEIDKGTILNCPGVFSFIKFNGVEAKIKDAEIAILKSIEESGYDVTQELGELKLLDEVEITQGQLKGLKGMVVLIQNTNYVQIQLTSLKQNIKVKLPIHILKTVSLQ